jgi:hypothetical protein
VDKEAGMSDHIINSKGNLVGVVIGSAIFDLVGHKLYDVKGANLYRLSGELIGHLYNSSGSERRLDRFTDRLFPTKARLPTPGAGIAGVGSAGRMQGH